MTSPRGQRKTSYKVGELRPGMASLEFIDNEITYVMVLSVIVNDNDKGYYDITYAYFCARASMHEPGKAHKLHTVNVKKIGANNVFFDESPLHEGEREFIL